MWSLKGDAYAKKKLFFELRDDKRTKIIETGIGEFAAHGYYNSSTNRIVKNAGISKGSLFQYFESKKDLYFYIIDFVTNELMVSLKEKAALPTDLFDRLMKYSELEFNWYIDHPIQYHLIIQAFSKNNTEIYQKTESRYHLKEQDIYYKLLFDIDSHALSGDKKTTLDILNGFKRF